MPSAALHAAFLTLVHKLYADPALARHELLAKVEPARVHARPLTLTLTLTLTVTLTPPLPLTLTLTLTLALTLALTLTLGLTSKTPCRQP